MSSTQSQEVSLQSKIPCRNLALSIRKNTSVQSRGSSIYGPPVGTRGGSPCKERNRVSRSAAWLFVDPHDFLASRVPFTRGYEVHICQCCAFNEDSAPLCTKASSKAASHTCLTALWLDRFNRYSHLVIHCPGAVSNLVTICRELDIVLGRSLNVPQRARFCKFGLENRAHGGTGSKSDASNSYHASQGTMNIISCTQMRPERLDGQEKICVVFRFLLLEPSVCSLIRSLDFVLVARTG